jgi:hypothetical protein
MTRKLLVRTAVTRLDSNGTFLEYGSRALPLHHLLPNLYVACRRTMASVLGGGRISFLRLRVKNAFGIHLPCSPVSTEGSFRRSKVAAE